MSEAVFFPLSQKHEWDEAEKSSLLQLYSSFFSSIYVKVVGEAILPNTFSKII